MIPPRVRSRALLFSALLLGGGCGATGLPVYEVTLLPFTVGAGINNEGKVIGNDSEQKRIYRWQNGVLTTVATMPGAYPGYASGHKIVAKAISPTGALGGYVSGIVGTSSTSKIEVQAATFGGGGPFSSQATGLGALPGSTSGTGNRYSMLQAINTAGTRVGKSTDSTGLLRPVLFGALSSVGAIGTGEGEAFDVNDSNRIVGRLNNRGFVSLNGVVTVLAAASGHTYSEARAINASGLVVGRSAQSTAYGAPDRIVTWNNGGAPVTVGALIQMNYHLPADINASGKIVGTVGNAGFVLKGMYADSTGLRLLNDMLDPGDPDAVGLTITQGVGINDSGWVLAQGSKQYLPNVAVLLRPILGPPMKLVSTKYVKTPTPKFQMTVTSRTCFNYRLKRSPDGVSPFVAVGSLVAGTGAPLVLSHNVTAGTRAFYVVEETAAP